MFQFINHYSFLIFVLPLLAVVLFVLLRGEGSRWKQILSVVLVLVTAALYFLFQPGERSLDATEAELELVAAGKPIMLEFYSDY
jgi:drug/metabolite transporter (DMT)-like permease